MIPCLFFAAAAIWSPEAVRAEMARIAESIPARVGAAAAVMEGGEEVFFHGDEHFPMQSVYKFPIAMLALHRVDARRLRLEETVTVHRSDLVPAELHSPIRDAHPQGLKMTVEELVRAAIVESDGTASDVLLRITGGPAAVTEYLRRRAVDGIAVATTENAMGHDSQAQYSNWATPVGAMALLRAFFQGRGLSTASRERLMNLMIESGPGANRIKGLLPAGTVVAHKTGSSGTVAGMTAATNDIGLVTLPDGRHLAVAVFVSDAKADTAAAEAVIAKIARAAWDAATAKVN